MIEQIGPVILAAIASGALGVIVGRIEVAHWRSEAHDLADTVTKLRRDIADARQLHSRQMDSKDDAIRALNHRLVPLEAREEKRLAQLRRIAPLGAKAQHEKRREARKVAVAKTLAAIPSLTPKSSAVGAARKSGSASL